MPSLTRAFAEFIAASAHTALPVPVRTALLRLFANWTACALGAGDDEDVLRVTAVALDGVTPIDINNGSNVVVNPYFTVSGKLAPVSAT